MKNLFIENYNKENRINVEGALDIYDECNFSYLDILKGKEVVVNSKVACDCKCSESVNFNVYYDKCDKCEGKGSLILNGNEVVCNHCHGSRKIVKNECPICKGSGKIVKRGNVKVSLNKDLHDGDIICLNGQGKESNGVKGNLYIKVNIKDKEYFIIKGHDVYDRRIISFSKEDISRGKIKRIETVKGYADIKSKGEEINEVLELQGEGIEDGSYYVCLENDLVEVKGKDAYKNIVVNKDFLNFYLNNEEIEDLKKKCLKVNYFKKVTDDNYTYVELDEVNDFKIVKLKKKGLKGKHGGDNGDLYLRIYFDDEFKNIDDKLYSFPIRLTKGEVSDGKKILEYNKTKIILNFEKNLKEEKLVEVKEQGFMSGVTTFDSVNFRVNPFSYEVYRVSVRADKKDKFIYLKDYKKYFYEEVNLYNEGLKVILNKNKEIETMDKEGNKVIVRVIR